ncbi:MAG: porphobilinogen synthase [Akkermansiaceae bacterium]|jgi:porphobilinogen synthase|nr:porphobilinogen synthase [Akkermansiaceae bacterium]MDG1852581.1 porphobilinogen synthase [Verrucomicrobiales bacterium]
MSNQNLNARPRRNRKSSVIRNLCRETRLVTESLIYPVFIHDKEKDESIESMPGCTRWSLNGLLHEISESCELGIGAIALFPAIDGNLKSPDAEESFNDNGLIPKTIRAIKDSFPELAVITDVALDPYNSDGHDGLVDPSGKVLNDETVAILIQQALCHARAGADIVAPSDMMDGRVGAIRRELDSNDFTDISILSYSAKYASGYYGPFRGALNSEPKSGDKKTYQMDPANAKEALREVMLDIEEGADMVMVKPAGPYLDVLANISTNVKVPVAAYQVSGEYLMIESASAAGWIDRKAVVMESLTGIHRAGASAILTYYAKSVAKWLK